MDSLIDFLPKGTTQYCRSANGDTWDVAVFEFGAVNRLMTVATGMDKNAALWLQTKLREARRENKKEMP